MRFIRPLTKWVPHHAVRFGREPYRMRTFTTSTCWGIQDQNPQPNENPQGLRPHFDYRYIRDNLPALLENAQRRNVIDKELAQIAPLQTRMTTLYQELVQLRGQRNDLGRQVSNIKRQQQTLLRKDPAADTQSLEAAAQELSQQARQVRERMVQLEAEHNAVQCTLDDLVDRLPNITHPTAPEGPEANARVVLTHGTPQTKPDLGNIKNHVQLCEDLDLVDFQAGSSVTGNSFYYLKNEAALLELALVQYAYQKAVARGFTPIIPPDLTRSDVLAGCGFRPRANEANQTYYVSHQRPGTTAAGSSHLCLAATSEVPLAGMFMNKRLTYSQLPQKFVAFGHCFRAEAGARGSETRGLYRVHQFSKVELFAVAEPAQSDSLLEEIRAFQQELFAELGLCYRVLDMPTFELGASAYRKYDIEAWMPGRHQWGEISSASNCTDYQARRLNIRYRLPSTAQSSKGAMTGFVHTLNGTACAVPRLIIAILETFQTPDGHVEIPKVLRPWMGGCEGSSQPAPATGKIQHTSTDTPLSKSDAIPPSDSSLSLHVVVKRFLGKQNLLSRMKLRRFFEALKFRLESQPTPVPALDHPLKHSTIPALASPQTLESTAPTKLHSKGGQIHFPSFHRYEAYRISGMLFTLLGEAARDPRTVTHGVNGEKDERSTSTSVGLKSYKESQSYRSPEADKLNEVAKAFAQLHGRGKVSPINVDYLEQATRAFLGAL
ncbi:Serine--tRNA ligase, mitochondrial [Dispira parvispora]|uniref:serine--tRNA ligase n=1 Tax=Dispira parvispora TaxID=1520584 RepID=A0A9W8ALP7_9FUNG|nr:Serine--tRNA ligase, mitochondrial [Dispira parvispora]